MGGSRRRLKRDAPKVRVGVQKRSKKLKAPTPREVSSKRPDIQAKLSKSVDWVEESTAHANYAKVGFANDPNAAAQVVAGEVTEDPTEQDDDMRTALGKQPVAGPKPPPPLTARQRQVVSQLISCHQDDVSQMAKDRKLNKMLLTEAQLRRMLQAYHLYPDGARVQFQQPKRKLW